MPRSSDDWVRFTAETTNANGFAFYCSLGILFAFYLITRREKTSFEFPAWLYWTFIVAAGLAIPLTGSCAGVASGAVAAVVLLSLLRSVSWKIRIGMVVAALLIGLLISRFVAHSTFDRIAEGTSSNTFLERWDAWVYGLKAWRETPVLGIGAASYQDAMEVQGHRRLVAHNTFVSVLVETGLVGFTLYFLFWGIAVRCAPVLAQGGSLLLAQCNCLLHAHFLTGSMEYQKVSFCLSP